MQGAGVGAEGSVGGGARGKIVKGTVTLEKSRYIEGK